jgi:hypothetical protein
LVFAFSNVLPAPPGVSGVLGLPLIYLSFQMMLGRMPWLPHIIADRSVPLDKFDQSLPQMPTKASRA